MTPIEQRVAIAAAVGWQCHHGGKYCSQKTDTLDKAAAILGIDIATLFRKRKRYKMPMRNTTGEKKT